MRFLNNFYEIFNFFLETQKSCDFFEKKISVFWHFFKKNSPSLPPPCSFKLSPSLRAYFYPPPCYTFLSPSPYDFFGAHVW